MVDSPSGSLGELPAALAEFNETGTAVEDASPNADSKLMEESDKLVEWVASGSELPKPDMNIGVAFDYMRVRVSDIKHMKKFTPALAALFEADQTNSVNDDATTPQAKSDMINRAKASKKSQQSTKTEKPEPRQSNGGKVSPRYLSKPLKAQRHGTKFESKGKGDVSSKVLQTLTDESNTKAVVTTIGNGPTLDMLPSSNIRPNQPP